MEVKRGYVKWTDENGVKHKMLKEEYEKKKDELVAEEKERSEEPVFSDESE